jgi:hypothetical protein
MKRRDFIKAGTLLSIAPQVIAQQIENSKSVIFLWLGGGASTFETFNVNNNIVGEKFESVVGKVHNPKTNMFLAGPFQNLINRSDKMTLVHSFSHTDSSHRHATHWLLSGNYNSERADTATSKYPSHGSFVSAYFGTANQIGLPTYVAHDSIDGDGPIWLGGQYKPFMSSNRDDLVPKVPMTHLYNRKEILNLLDKQSSMFHNNPYDKYKEQAYSTLIGQAKEAFNLEQEKNNIVKYGDTNIGKQLLLTKRLILAGTKVVNIHYGGFDLHTDIRVGMERLLPKLDVALSALIDDLFSLDKLDDTLIVVTSEFGRTAYNQTNGRDHWPALVPLALIGGKYTGGRVIGKMDKNNYNPDSEVFRPIDLQHTIFNHLGMDLQKTFIDTSGRPRYLLAENSRIIV